MGKSGHWMWVALIAFLTLPGFKALAEEPTASSANTEASTESNVKWSDVVGYNKGFYIKTPDDKFSLTIGGYVQGLGLVLFEEGKPNTDTFRVRRARMKFFGHLYEKNIQYQFEYDFAANKLLSTYISYVWGDELAMWLGQNEVPFNFESITSSSAQQFVDRSLVHAFFGIADEREPGIGISGAVADKKFEYMAAATNGEGLNTLNQNNEVRWTGRVVYNISGHHGYEFSDVKWSEEPQMALGVAGMYNDTPTTGVSGSPDKKVGSLTADFGIKYLGWGGHAAFYYQNTGPAVGAGTDDNGFVAQLGYFFVPKEWEVAARYGRVNPDAGKTQSEITGGLNYYIHDGHKVKLQVDYSYLVVEDGIAVGNDKEDQRIRAQLQVKL